MSWLVLGYSSHDLSCSFIEARDEATCFDKAMPPVSSSFRGSFSTTNQFLILFPCFPSRKCRHWLFECALLENVAWHPFCYCTSQRTKQRRKSIFLRYWIGISNLRSRASFAFWSHTWPKLLYGQDTPPPPLYPPGK